MRCNAILQAILNLNDYKGKEIFPSFAFATMERFKLIIAGFIDGDFKKIFNFPKAQV
jgi:hypothetical protein